MEIAKLVKTVEFTGRQVVFDGHLGLKVYGVARDTDLNRMFRKIFSLPNPLELIKVLSEAEIARVDDYVCAWYEVRQQTSPASE